MARRKYPQEVEDFIRASCTTYTARQMAAMITAELGFDVTPEQVHGFMSNHKIRGPRKGKKRPDRRITTPEIDDFIRERVAGTSPAAMAEMVNAAFGTAYSAAQIKAYYARNHLASGIDARFQPGRPAPNKGLTWDEYMAPEAQERARRGCFKRGHIPHNGGTPIGAMRIRRMGRTKRPYAFVKVAQPNVWRMAHVVEWEKHNGPVPDGYMVTFANGNTLDCTIGNLLLESRAQHAVKNRWDIHGYDQESGQAANLIADLKMAVNEKRRKR